MRLLVVLLATAAFVIHMTMGCCFAHHHPSATGDSARVEARAKHCCHDCSKAPSESNPPSHDHNHPCHEDGCMVTLAAGVQLPDEVGSSPVMEAIIPPLSLSAAICPCVSARVATEIPALPVRAHLAKLVMTI